MPYSLKHVCLAISIASAVLFDSMQGVFGKAGNGANTEMICHNGHIIWVAPAAVAAHMRHGDRRGACFRNGALGDPHFKTWAGDNYDFHGVCDLVLVQNHGFKDDLEMEIQIRTKQLQQWSFISAAALRIGSDTLEIMGGFDDKARFWVNGVTGDENLEDGVWLPESLSGYPIRFSKKDENQHEYSIYLDDDQVVVLSTDNDYVRIDIVEPKESDFASSLGLLGKFGTGERVARDGATVIEDVNAFGQEWQVGGTETHLFHNIEGPQFPQQCMIPDASTQRRQLRNGVHTITEGEAQKICSHVVEHDRSLCIFDVLQTNDRRLAQIY